MPLPMFSELELSFVASSLKVRWEDRIDSSRRCLDGKSLRRPFTTTVQLVAPHVPSSNPLLLFDAYETAQAYLNELLVCEAVASVNDAVKAEHFRSHKWGDQENFLDSSICAPQTTKSVQQVRVAGAWVFFTLVFDIHSGHPVKKRNPGGEGHSDENWGVSAPRRGDVLLLSLSTEEILRAGLLDMAVHERLEDHDSRVHYLEEENLETAPILRPGLVLNSTRVLFAVDKSSSPSLVEALCGWEHPRRGGGIYVLKLPNRRRPSLLDLVRHSRALATVGPSPYAQYVTDPRGMWQFGTDSRGNVLESLYLEEVKKSGGSYRSPTLTEDQRIAPLVLGTRVLQRANIRRSISGSANVLGNSVFLAVQGPPGSGKSTTIVNVVTNCLGMRECGITVDTARGSIVRNHPRFLLSAPTNFAIDELVYRFTIDTRFGDTVANFASTTSAASLRSFDEIVEAFLDCCALVRIGTCSSDDRAPVAECFENRVNAKVLACVRDGVTAARGRIEELRLESTRLDTCKAEVTRCLTMVQQYDRNDNHSSFVIDDVQYELDGTEAGIANLRRLVTDLDAEKGRIKEEIGAVEEDIVKVKRFFRYEKTVMGEDVDLNFIRLLILANSVCVFSTCDGAATLSETLRSRPESGYDFSAAGFDLVLVDEAGRCTIPQLLVPVAAALDLQREDATHTFDVCAVGDPCQSRAVVQSTDLVVRDALAQSFLERALKLLRLEEANCTGAKPWAPAYLTMLRQQFRMHPAISAFPREAFYAGELQDGLDGSHFDQPWYATECSNGIGPLLFVATDYDDKSCACEPSIVFKGETFARKSFPYSRGNIGEALLLVDVLVSLKETITRDFGGMFDERKSRERKPTVLVLAPYKLQKVIIEEILRINQYSKHSTAGGPSKGTQLRGWRALFHKESQDDVGSDESFESLILPRACAQLGQSGRIETGADTEPKGIDCLQFLERISAAIQKLPDFFDISVSTVDASIGCEVDIVLQTKVAKNSDFLRDERRMCVGLTRASSLLVVCGETELSSSIRRDSDNYWQRFAWHCKDRGCLLPVQQCLRNLARMKSGRDSS